MNESMPFNVDRPWGNFRQFTMNELSTVKLINIEPNAILSLQSHNKRREFWRVISGSGYIVIDDQKIDVREGDEHLVPLGTRHRMAAGASGMQMLEISFGEFDEEDIVRYEDKYGRVS